ncbi:hypothetical protein [Affinirhizobium pseudoryzae]|uniref:hypothetical protein n=1 Tax=Allorhizobium pseudoryzae TaxID=379684 RepID=UPI0013ED29C7|nr:hypothetical protein [Allorhizobium pseudoryzae]
MTGKATQPITRFTNEGGGAAGDGGSRSGEIDGLVGFRVGWFVDFAGFLITTLANGECEPRFRFWLGWLIDFGFDCFVWSVF